VDDKGALDSENSKGTIGEKKKGKLQPQTRGGKKKRSMNKNQGAVKGRKARKSFAAKGKSMATELVDEQTPHRPAKRKKRARGGERKGVWGKCSKRCLSKLKKDKRGGEGNHPGARGLSLQKRGGNLKAGKKKFQ